MVPLTAARRSTCYEKAASVAQQGERSAAAESGIDTLPSVLDVRAAPALAESLRHYIASAETVALDGQMIERVSTPCLQILLATALDTQSRGITSRLAV